MRFGVVLPAGGDVFERDILTSQALPPSLWLRDWPTKGLNGDLSTGWDALTYAMALVTEARVRKTEPTITGLGFGALRIDKYDPIHLARSVCTLGSFSLDAGVGLTVGITFGPNQGTNSVESCAEKWQVFYEALTGNDDRFELPPDWVIPAILVCSDSEEKWNLVGKYADGWLTSEYRPSLLSSGIHYRQKTNTNLKTVLQLRAGIREGQIASAERDNSGQLWFSVEGFARSIKTWNDLGIAELALWPNAEGAVLSVSHLLDVSADRG